LESKLRFVFFQSAIFLFPQSNNEKFPRLGGSSLPCKEISVAPVQRKDSWEASRRKTLPSRPVRVPRALRRSPPFFPRRKIVLLATARPDSLPHFRAGECGVQHVFFPSANSFLDVSSDSSDARILPREEYTLFFLSFARAGAALLFFPQAPTSGPLSRPDRGVLGTRAFPFPLFSLHNSGLLCALSSPFWGATGGPPPFSPSWALSFPVRGRSEWQRSLPLFFTLVLFFFLIPPAS